ncbi:hypothetical protein H3Z83_05585 [Tenacibaculum sp. S7007]|uniref:Peptidase M56 domain-containing protein n=1 Tax=Tenacibaculum pelagium TaxID=2759527 RepID=A0A839AP48_9FLAO|nr:M56 family metallopeptidase [Tenacibaculum pelagium]MBA6155989.1 hypothetical protein [Tenacibaculum pelagium]
MIVYFLKSFICLALLLAFYHLVLEREKMHQFNRFYLLGSILFSFIAPLYKIYIEVAQTIVENTQPLVLDYPIPTEITEPVQETNYMQYALFVYLTISLILTIRFIKNLVAIYLKTKQHKKIKKGKVILVLVDDLISPHTFWNYIFINKEEYYSNKIETELYTHELTHALQKHTFDILLIEVLQIVFWINPTYILLKKAIKLNHEFLADSNVITKHKNTSEYQYLLLNRVAWNNEYYLASNLNYLLTKKRLLMITKQSSRTKILFKKLAVIPVLAGFTFLFAERVEAENSEIKFIDSEVIDKQKNEEKPEEVLKDIKEKLKDVNSLKLSLINQTPILKIDIKKNLFYLNNRLIELKDLKKEFIKETEGGKSDLKIDINGKILMSTIKNIQRKIGKEHLNKILLFNAQSYILDDETSLKTSNIDSIPKHRRVINLHKGTFMYTDKNGKVISKKISELTDEEKKMIPPPPPPVGLVKKTVTKNLLDKLKNSKKYAVWIDGKVINNNVLNNYKPSDFYNYMGSFVHKNARSKRFPQEYQYQLNTKKHIDKRRKHLPPPPPKSKTKVLAPPPPKTGFYESNGQKLYYVQKGKEFTFYNKYGQVVTKQGKVINPNQTASDKVIPGQNITKVYKDNKVVTRFKNTNLPPPPPKANFLEVKKGKMSNIPPPPKSDSKKFPSYPPPPPPMSAKELVFKYPSATYYFNNKKVSHEKVLDLLKNRKRINVLTQEKNGNKVIKFTSKDFVK